MILLDLKQVTSDDGPTTICVSCTNVDDLLSTLLGRLNIPEDSFYLTSRGRIVKNASDLGHTVQVVPRLVGGKGGFGSMLRAIGAQIEKTTNREACRDLSGRRLRDINEEQRLKKWITQQAEREREEEEKKKKKLEKLILIEPRHKFKDPEYDAERADLTEKLEDAVEHGLKASTSGVKRDNEIEPERPVKKRKTILDEDFSSSEDDEEDTCEESLVPVS